MNAEGCDYCGDLPPEPGDDECVLCEHQQVVAGDAEAALLHDLDECEECLLKCAVKNDCRCGKCCESLIIEVSLRDGVREPKIREQASPIYGGFTGERVQIGWLLNGKGGPCVFLDPDTKDCTIYETRPLVCRLYDCRDYNHGDDAPPPEPAGLPAGTPAAGGRPGEGSR
jgi:Fe-S-cluster containining protein